MVEFKKTIDILRKEKAYEDELVHTLGNYYLISLDGITDINDKERKKIKDTLSKIMHESIKHRYQFNQLLQMVMEHGKNNF